MLHSILLNYLHYTDPDKGLDGFYAGTGQVIDYKVTLVNTGDITLDIDLEDVFVNAEYFEFVDTNKASVSIEPEETREVIFLLFFFLTLKLIQKLLLMNQTKQLMNYH